MITRGLEGTQKRCKIGTVLYNHEEKGEEIQDNG